MKSYCVKEKKQTECVVGSEKKVRTQTGRLMLQCKCATPDCGITKTRFIKDPNKNTKTGGNIQTTKPYCGVKRIPKNKHRGTIAECLDSGRIAYYGLKEVPQGILDAQLTPYQKRKIRQKVGLVKKKTTTKVKK